VNRPEGLIHQRKKRKDNSALPRATDENKEELTKKLISGQKK
jgi:hypothetical protein